MTTIKKTYPVVELSPEEEKELRYILTIPDAPISHEELMYLRHAQEIYA
jgi:DNA-directed RNA polymerase subunit F